MASMKKTSMKKTSTKRKKSRRKVAKKPAKRKGKKRRAKRRSKRGVLSARLLSLRPGPGKAVVGDPAEQEGIDARVVVIDRAAHVLVEVREVPGRVDLGDAVERDEQGGDDRRHGVASLGCPVP